MKPSIPVREISFGAKEINATNEAVNGLSEDMVDLKKSVSDGKTQVAAAITAKRVPTAATATFGEMATNIGKNVLEAAMRCRRMFWQVRRLQTTMARNILAPCPTVAITTAGATAKVMMQAISGCGSKYLRDTIQRERQCVPVMGGYPQHGRDLQPISRRVEAIMGTYRKLGRVCSWPHRDLYNRGNNPV